MLCGGGSSRQVVVEQKEPLRPSADSLGSGRRRGVSGVPSNRGRARHEHGSSPRCLFFCFREHNATGRDSRAAACVFGLGREIARRHGSWDWGGVGGPTRLTDRHGRATAEIRLPALIFREAGGMGQDSFFCFWIFLFLFSGFVFELLVARPPSLCCAAGSTRAAVRFVFSFLNLLFFVFFYSPENRSELWE
jgi:hypothetical protein